MRDLTEEELAKCPIDCDYYHIIDRNIYFTSVLGIGVYDINGNIVDDSLLDGVFQKSKPINKPFDITQHDWGDDKINGARVDADCLLVDDSDYDVSTVSINKKDAIAIAKHFNLL